MQYGIISSIWFSCEYYGIHKCDLLKNLKSGHLWKVPHQASKNNFQNIVLCHACMKSQEQLDGWKQEWKLYCHDISLLKSGSSYDGICFKQCYLLHSNPLNLTANTTSATGYWQHVKQPTLEIMSLTELLHKSCFCGVWFVLWVMSGEHLQMYLVKAAVQKTSSQEDDTWGLSQEMLYQSWS